MRLLRALFAPAKGPQVGEMTIKYSNLPERYIKRAMRQVEFENPKGKPQYLRRTLERRVFKYGTHRQWTAEFYQDNLPPKKFKPDLVEPVVNWSFFRGDRVEILVGRDKGKQGMILHIYQERNWVIVEGLNTEIKIVGKTNEFPGVAVRWEKPLNVTHEVKLVDPSDLKGTDMEWRYTEDGEKVRVSLRSGRIIPIPPMAEETYDYKTKSAYREGDKDTTADDLSKITFKPHLCTFDMDIMQKMGIQEERTPGKTYWY